jgi:hypothetical protein
VNNFNISLPVPQNFSSTLTFEKYAAYKDQIILLISISDVYGALTNITYPITVLSNTNITQ